MKEKEFEEFLHKQIPITKEMGIGVVEFTSNKVKLSAKLEPNLNHKCTVFGGSINSLMTISGWSVVYANIKEVDRMHIL